MLVTKNKFLDVLGECLGRDPGVPCGTRGFRGGGADLSTGYLTDRTLIGDGGDVAGLI